MDKTPKVPPADCRRTPAPRARSRQACRSTDLPHPRRRSGRSPQIGLDPSQPSAVRQCGLGLEQKPAALDGVLDGGSDGTEGRAMLALDLRHKGVHERAHGSTGFWRSGVLDSISVACLRPSAIAAAGILEWQSRGTLGHARRRPRRQQRGGRLRPTHARRSCFGAFPRKTLRAMAVPIADASWRCAAQIGKNLSHRSVIDGRLQFRLAVYIIQYCEIMLDGLRELF